MAENNGKHTTINPEGKTTLTIVAILFFVINLPLFLIPAIMGWWSYAALGLTLLFVLFFPFSIITWAAPFGKKGAQKKLYKPDGLD